ncbi:MAG: hypothetical protein CVU57_15190 [Deltaproteobacteria bacterium HGW-Deltaproteobacteria-15]|jgi:hypothetical protein|nr:MAG: hypothetical protein CVU57_15190 [Deltaproteobacteria bacterium HGW-Deltaproteobacteria-15]
MRTVLVLVFTALFLLSSGNVMAQQGKAKAKGASEKAYEHANEKANFIRDGSTPTEKGKEALGEAKDASLSGKGKTKELKTIKSTKTQGKEAKSKVEKSVTGTKVTTQ